MQKLFNWLDKYLLEVGVGLLLFLIPLYPKLPLIDVPNTWVYVRFEDVIVAAVVGIWLIQLLRRQVSLKVPLAIPIFIYWLIGGISLLFSLVFLRAHLANFFPHVAVLHYLRRIEYLIVFFIAASSIKNLERVKTYLVVIALALVGVCFYGLGQKFLGFPAFLTMNEEFAKGIPFYLPPTARISSTFAGHYDLAAYLVLIIALFGSLIFGLKKWLSRILLFILIFTSFIMLLLTASRISFLAYLLAISFVLYLQKKKWLIIPVILVSFFLMNFVTGASDRFGKTFRVERVVYDVRTGKPIAAEAPAPGEPEETLPLGTGFLAIPVIETTPPEATQVAVIRKSLKTATMSSEIATISGEFLIRRTIVYDISFTTRFQGTWPRALNAYRRNPLLGTGYSSINLGTDNSYLRALGETGLLGFLAFLGLFFSLGLLVKQALTKMKAPFGRSILIGMFAGTLGLMLNAILIDVFEASKVAFVFWGFWGIAAGMVNYYLPKRRSLLKEAMAVVKLPIVPILILAFVAPLVLGYSLENYFVADDFTWLRWAATARLSDLPQFFLNANNFFYRPLAKVYFFLVSPVFGMRPSPYHLLDFFLHFGCVLAVYFLVIRLTKKRFISLLTALLFLIHPLNGESVFWISSTSALMAAFFYLWGFLAYVFWRSSRKRWRPLLFLATVLAFVLGLASHERMITFPLALILYDFVFGHLKKTKQGIKKLVPYLPFWALTALYLWLRNVVAQAHVFSGDYSYNLLSFPFNFVGNLIGYTGEMIASFHFLPYYDLARALLRANKSIALIFLLAGIGFFVSLLAKKKLLRRLGEKKLLLFSFGWFVVLLLPFLGFGNIAERHVYPAHFGLLLLMALFINWIYEKLKKQHHLLALIIALVIVGGVLGFYRLEMEKAKQEWQRAGEINNQVLLALGSNYAEFPLKSTLYFINLPIRYGRAWVFPVGLEDGIWFIYRDETLTINRATDLEETLGLIEGKPNSYVFIYEGGELKEVKK